MSDHEVCQFTTDINVGVLRAWARAVTFAADVATPAELAHAVVHFEQITAATGQLDQVDQACLETLRDELSRR